MLVFDSETGKFKMMRATLNPVCKRALPGLGIPDSNISLDTRHSPIWNPGPMAFMLTIRFHRLPITTFPICDSRLVKVQNLGQTFL